MSKLVSLETPQFLIAIFDLVFHRPRIQISCKRAFLVWAQRRERRREEVRAGILPLCSDLLLLCLDRSYHFLVHERDDMLFVGLALIGAQIPLVLIITDQTIER